jgi:uncharacterized protein (DUF305 family)
MTLRRLLAPTIALALTMMVAACGADDSATSTSAALNAADIEFAQGMIAHHEQAIEMADIALDPRIGASADVVDLATRIKGAQDPEVDLMTGWLTAAGEPVAMDTHGGHDMSSMAGMMTAEQMGAMASMMGAAFDRMWLEMMIAHHEGAIVQSQTVKADGSNADVLAFADRIIAAQQAEIAEMRALLQG